jgi:hypothetical protein
MDRKATWAAIAGFVVIAIIDYGNVYIWPMHPVPPELRDAVKEVTLAVIKGLIGAVLIYIVASRVA